MAACRGGVITVTGNPQGQTSAPVGTIATNGTCWYQKLFGGNTPYGWYPMHNPFMSGNYFGSNVAKASSGSAPVIFGVGATNGLAASSGGGSVIPQNAAAETARKIVVLRTGAADPSHAFVRVSTIATAFDGVLEQTPAGNEFAWDLVTVVRTTPNAPATTTTTLADLRLWSGVSVGSLTDLVIGGIADSDTLQVALATQFAGVTSGSYGAFFRFSTVAGDAGWVVVTTNENGIAFSQTVTPIVAIAANTYYRLRLRYDPAPPRRIFASVNDGTEVIITANAGPGNVAPGTLGVLAFKPASVVTCKTAGASKSLGWTKTTWMFGDC